MRARFLHASQLRLDAPITGCRHIGASVRDRVRDATLDTLHRIVDAACAHHVDGVLFTGDLFAGPEHGVRAQLAFSKAVEQLADHGIAVVAVAGPGDSGDPWFPSVSSWPDGVAIVAFGQQETITLRHRGQPLVTIHAIAAGSSSNTAAAHDGPAGDGMHVAVVGGEPSNELVLRTEFDHIAHGGTNLGRAERRGDQWITTPGTAQHLHSRDVVDAIGEVDIFTVDSAEVQSEPQRLPVGAVHLARMIVDVDPLIDLDALRADLEARADRLASADQGRTLLVSADLVGVGSTHRALQASQARRDELLETLRSRSLSVTPSLWWTSLDPVASPDRETRAVDRADFSALLSQLGGELAQPENRSIREGWLRTFPSDLRTLGDDERSADTRWAEARRIAEAALATSERTKA